MDKCSTYFNTVFFPSEEETVGLTKLLLSSENCFAAITALQWGTNDLRCSDIL